MSRTQDLDGTVRSSHSHIQFVDTPDELSEAEDVLPSGSILRLKSPPDSPAARTGPPRSFAFAVYSSPASPTSVRPPSGMFNFAEPQTDLEADDPDVTFNTTESDFRGALEYRPDFDKKGKRRERQRTNTDDTWNINPIKWFHDSPKDEKPPMDFPPPPTSSQSQPAEVLSHHSEATPRPQPESSSSYSFFRRKTRAGSGHDSDTATDVNNNRSTILRRAFSVPHSPTNAESSDTQTKDKEKRLSQDAASRWSRIRALLPTIVHPQESILPGPSAVTSQAVNITDELITGGLVTLMLRLWFERDEKGHRRIPVLLHRLRIRVSDSIHPTQGHKSVFRIECEYANGAARWVIYRQLKDFISLHYHYTLSNTYNQNVDKMPQFPATSIPYFKFLRKEGKEKGQDVGRADFARLQREALENYLIELIRAVMFHPSANRLAGFLEISALSIGLAQSGGAQYKAGYLRILSTGSNSGGFGRKSASWKEKNEQRWCAVRESYLVVMEEPGELTVWDVFLLDSEFRIERPKRYYRQNLGHLLHKSDDEDAAGSSSKAHHDDHLQAPGIHIVPPEGDRRSVIGSLKSKVSKIFHRDGSTRDHGDEHAEATDFSDTASSTSSIPPPRARTPLLDPSINTNVINTETPGSETKGNLSVTKKAAAKKRAGGDVSKHTFYIINSQMRLKLFAKNERQMLQFITALEKVAASSHFISKNRFDSFAPIRLNVSAQWLVDGRDYFWNLSRALLLARESIYIHDWWLSPELLMRRPDKPRYRLDKILEKKAKEGVKIYLILYQEVSNRTTPTDSNYAKQRLMALHPSIMVQRAPSHFQTGTFYWAHHEKMCVIDQTIAFMGGLDLCLGRWDTPQHVLTDDTEDTDLPQIWPGKDYSNPRVSDFHTLNRPEEDMYDRSKVPRMPWHDVAMQIVGQPARDLARHFVERWNYLLRIKNHSRLMPFLLPPPEFRPGELTTLGLTGTCELQICRSAGPWSMGTTGRVEHSIQNAYLKAIQMSEHFVYIENQFFITSTVVNDVKIENNIGDAIVHRIIRAHRDGTPWKCCIMIPLLPGFTFPVDHSDASAIRIILECQNRTLGRGPNSIFSRLHKEGINPEDYISVFSLRNWAKMRGDVLTTEQVYIHAKVLIVDDRLAIIGSANINERSQRGDRDSELAAVIRDTDLIDSTMAGRPFKVGRFAHTLRVRLMREHLGIDVDGLDEDDLVGPVDGVDGVQPEDQQTPWDPSQEQLSGDQEEVTYVKNHHQKYPASAAASHLYDTVKQAVHAEVGITHSRGEEVIDKMGMKGTADKADAGYESQMEERTDFDIHGKQIPGFATSHIPTLEEKVLSEERPPAEQVQEDDHSTLREAETSRSKAGTPATNGSESLKHRRTRTKSNGLRPGTAQSQASRPSTSASSMGGGGVEFSKSGFSDADDSDAHLYGAAGVQRSGTRARSGSRLGGGRASVRRTWNVNALRPKVGPEDFEDPISEYFWDNIWVASAVYNTEIYRKVFHAIPDDGIHTWKQYKEFVAHHDRLNKPTRESTFGEPVATMPSDSGEDGSPSPLHDSHGNGNGSSADARSEFSREGAQSGTESPGTTMFMSSSTGPLPEEQYNGKSQPGAQSQGQARKPAKGSEPFEKWERDEMEKLLTQLNGHLVTFPLRFLEGEDIANNFLFNADRMLPLPIYN